MTSRPDAPHPTARRATAVVLGGVLAWVALTVLTVSAQVWSVAWVLSAVVVGASWLAARVLIRDIAERQVSEVDEYELAQRNGARNAGYVAALVAAALLYVLLSAAAALAERGSEALLELAPQLVLVAFLPAAAGPTLLLAWRLRSQVDVTD